MTTDLQLVSELRALFKGGATPSVVVRRIAERHEGEAMLDRTVRHYFRVAFGVPMARIGPEMVEAICRGDGVPSLNTSLLHLMIELRPEWDTEPCDGSWLETVTATSPATLLGDTELQDLPELAESWDRLDEMAKRYIRRTSANARSLYEQVNALAALAERLQEQVEAATHRPVAPAAA